MFTIIRCPLVTRMFLFLSRDLKSCHIMNSITQRYSSMKSQISLTFYCFLEGQILKSIMSDKAVTLAHGHPKNTTRFSHCTNKIVSSKHVVGVFPRFYTAFLSVKLDIETHRCLFFRISFQIVSRKSPQPTHRKQICDCIFSPVIQ